MAHADDKKKVLEMLAGGKISTDDAERLLDRLDAAANGDHGPEGEAAEEERATGSRSGAAENERAAGSRSGADAGFRESRQGSPGRSTAVVEAVPPRSGKGPRFLRVVVDSHDGDKVNIRVPVALIRTGIKFTSMIPNHAREAIQEEGLDLSHLSELDGQELIQALEELSIDVDSSDGDKVRVFCE